MHSVVRAPRILGWEGREEKGRERGRGVEKREGKIQNREGKGKEKDKGQEEGKKMRKL